MAKFLNWLKLKSREISIRTLKSRLSVNTAQNFNGISSMAHLVLGIGHRVTAKSESWGGDLFMSPHASIFVDCSNQVNVRVTVTQQVASARLQVKP